MKNRRIILAVTIALAVLLPTAALAVDPTWLPIVPCGSAGQPQCTPCSVFEALKNVSDLILYGITGPVAAFIFVLAGGMFLVGSDSPTYRNRAKTLMTNTAIGLAVLFLAWLGTDFLIKSIATGGTQDSWYQFTCPAALAGISAPNDLSSTLNAPPVSYVPVTVPKYLSALPLSACPSANINICPAANTMTCGSCRDRKDTVTDPATNKTSTHTYAEYIDKYAQGAATAGLINAIMYAESSCSASPPPSGAGAYGLMQLQPATANQFKNGCLKPDPKTGEISSKPIDAGWLSSGQHVEESICIAAKFINSLAGACGTDPRNLAAGYNAGPGYCGPSRDCLAPAFQSCSGGVMRAWECPYDNPEHTVCNGDYVTLKGGLNETKLYAPKVAICTNK